MVPTSHTVHVARRCSDDLSPLSRAHYFFISIVLEADNTSVCNS